MSALLSQKLTLKLFNMKTNWQTKTLKEVVKIQSGFGFPKSMQGRTNEFFPFIKVSDMNLPGNEKFIQKWNNTVSKKDVKDKGYKVAPAGTIVFPKIGGAIGTNKKRILTTDSLYDNNVMGLIPTKEILSDYLFFWISNFDLSDWAVGATLPAITQARVENTEISFPEISEQREIINNVQRILGDILNVKIMTEKKMSMLNELKKSVLQKALSKGL